MKFDEYTLKARILPTAIVLSPVGIAACAWFPFELTDWKTFIPAGLYLSALHVLGEIGRDQGKRKEPALHASWGGKPTTQWLRHRSTLFDPITRARYHASIAQLIGRAMPTAAREEKDPVGADAVYDSGVNALIERTRDKEKFPLLFNENVSYGFRRNLWGMKPDAIVVAALGLLVASVPIFLALLTDKPAATRAIVCTLTLAVLLAMWCARVTRSWVRIPADGYAQRLLASCETFRTESK